jgi:hypothetical protein
MLAGAAVLFAVVGVIASSGSSTNETRATFDLLADEKVQAGMGQQEAR